MIIKTDTWHYKVYSWTYRTWTGTEPPPNTNLCQYMRRIVLIPPFLAIFYVLLTALYYGIMTPFALLFGFRPFNLYAPAWVNGEEIFEGYDGAKMGPFRLYPIHFILLAGVIALQVVGVHRHWIFWGEGFLLAIAALVIGLLWFFNAESTQLLRQWVAARKAGICPLVDFEDSKEETK